VASVAACHAGGAYHSAALKNDGMCCWGVTTGYNSGTEHHRQHGRDFIFQTIFRPSGLLSLEDVVRFCVLLRQLAGVPPEFVIGMDIVDCA